MTKSSQEKCQNCIPFLESPYTEMQRNIYLEYMNINHEPEATRLMIDIKHQPCRVLVDVQISIEVGNIISGLKGLRQNQRT